MSSSNLAVARGVLTITPHDTNLLARSARAIYVGVGGNIKVRTHDGSEATFTEVPQGSVLPVECVKVYATGTTASNLVGLI